MAEEPALIIQVPQASAIERQLQDEPPPSLRADDVLVQTGPTDEQGNLEALAGEVVLSVASPGELGRQRDEVERVLRGAGTGTAPLVIVVQAAEELHEDEAAPVLAGARRSPRPVILRFVRPSEV